MSEITNDQNASDNTRFCHNCGSALQSHFKFCSSCGTQTSSANPSLPLETIQIKQKISFKMIAVSLVTAGLLFSSAYFLNPSLIGKEPAHKQTPKPAPGSIDQLYSQAENAIKNISQSESPTSAQLLEAVDLLSQILQAEPKDPWALIQMAELSFNQRMFDKSSELYARYLEQNPEDQTVRSRYASSLTFAGKSDQAIKELDVVLQKSPDNFQALAFSAIAYSEIGQKDKARELLGKAISLAPNEEAKTRLNKFAESIDAPSAAPSQENKIASFENYLKTHQIAGPKFKGIEAEGDKVFLNFAEFPMDKMPPVVKDKFTNNVLQQALQVPELKGKKILFRDQGSLQIMAEVNVE